MVRISLEERVGELEHAVAVLEHQQLAVNTALLAYLETQHPFKYGHEGAAALREALLKAIK